MKQTLITILISFGLILACFFAFKSCNKHIISNTITTHTTDTQFVYLDTTIFKDKISYINIKDTEYINSKIDTALILDAYFATNVYFDTLTYNNNSVSLIDTISENKIKNRTAIFNFTERIIHDSVTITNTVVKEPKKFNFMVGGGITSNKNLYIENILTYNKIGFNVGIDNKLNYRVGIVLKIK